MYLVTYSCIKLSNYLDIICTRKYEDINNTKQTTYVYELKVFSYTCKRLEVHITSAP